MAIFPGGSLLPGCDPPYPIVIVKNGQILLETDDCGITFKIIGDKYLAAQIWLERAIESGKGVISPNNFVRQSGPIVVVFKNFQPVDIEPNRKEDVYYKGKLCREAENRPEVLEMVEIMKSILKMKAFW